MKYDFSGYATKFDVKCSDGRTIRKGAFKHHDGETVPLVWQHLHNEPTNILGHALLENREDGVYAFAKFNDTDAGQNAKKLVAHGDVKALSIYANRLKQKGGDVIHGAIREVSLVLTGANPEARIDYLNFAHADGSIDIDETEAVIYSGLELDLEEEENVDPLQHKERTVKDVFDSMNEEQKNVVYIMIAEAMKGEGSDDAKHSDYEDEGDEYMKRNVFDLEYEDGATLSHADVQDIFRDAQSRGSLKEAWLAHDGEGEGEGEGSDPLVARYGIENIDYLFPDAKLVNQTPHFISREMGWVPGVLSGVHNTPFSRIKSTAADITADEARALGYVKGNLKKEEVISLLKRVTTPQTIYKKQKLDRDDIIDITDFDVVAWLKREMRMMLDEEIARAVLIGDGRDPESEDKIQESHIRPIWTDNDMYAHKAEIEANKTAADLVDTIIRARENYKGTGNPKLYVPTSVFMDMLLVKDTLGRRLYKTKTELAAALLVSDIVEVPVMAGLTRENEGSDTLKLVAIMVNLKDYNIGADKGGAVNLFDDFDIDYNQYKYLIETRISGALVKPKSAIVFEQVVADDNGGTTGT